MRVHFREFLGRRNAIGETLCHSAVMLFTLSYLPSGREPIWKAEAIYVFFRKASLDLWTEKMELQRARDHVKA